ncbi:phage portal protein [Vagococcus fessus]|uniref:Phage portal protein n=1 Tax=Vagococcus fessus TaxID=120370 RepID=A0A430A592_9ENTE|nr:phage portal protein [Vagococcus fessus]RSU01959.1 phage portal protein [Vagococcus fessus]
MAYFRGLGTPSDEDILIESIIGRSMSSSYTGINALKNSDVLAGISIIAGDVASFPIVQKNKKGTIEDMGDLSYILNTKATTNAGARSWRFSMVVQSILNGNSYSRILKDSRGKVWGLEYFPPSEVLVEQDTETKELRYTFASDGKNIICEPEEVFHLKMFTSDTVFGRSPLLSLKEDIELQESGRNTLSKFFKTGTSSGILKMAQAKLSPEARKKVKKEFEEVQNGGGHSAIVLDSTMDYKQLEIDTNILQLINSNNYSTSQIAKCLRIPAYKLAVNSPNQSVEQLNRDYVNNDLTYYMDAFIEEANLKLMSDKERRRSVFDFDTSRLTDVDQETKIANITKKVKDGLITVNEGRQELGYERLDGEIYDKPVISLNYTFQDELINKQALKGGDDNDRDRSESIDTEPSSD